MIKIVIHYRRNRFQINIISNIMIIKKLNISRKMLSINSPPNCCQFFSMWWNKFWMTNYSKTRCRPSRIESKKMKFRMMYTLFIWISNQHRKLICWFLTKNQPRNWKTNIKMPNLAWCRRNFKKKLRTRIYREIFNDFNFF